MPSFKSIKTWSQAKQYCYQINSNLYSYENNINEFNNFIKILENYYEKAINTKEISIHIGLILTNNQTFKWTDNNKKKDNYLEFFKLLNYTHLSQEDEEEEEDEEKCFAIKISKKKEFYRSKLQILNSCTNGAFNYMCKFTIDYCEIENGHTKCGKNGLCSNDILKGKLLFFHI